MPVANHRKCMKTLKRRLDHLEKRIRDNTSKEPLTYDISEARALRYAINMSEMYKSMIGTQAAHHSAED